LTLSPWAVGHVPLRIGDGIPAGACHELEGHLRRRVVSVASVSLPASTVTSAPATALASP
jgi:hypothetical protein